MKKKNLIKLLLISTPFIFSNQINAQINNGANPGITGSTSSSSGINNTGGGYYSFSSGGGNSASGPYSSAFGLSNVSSASSTIAGGGNSQATGHYSIALGRYAKSLGVYSRAIGYYSEAIGHYSFSIGNNLRANSDYSFVIGNGAGITQPLNNSISNSLMIGFNSNIPTLFIGESDGIGTSGFVGIGTFEPKGKLDVHSEANFAAAPRFTMSSPSQNLSGVNTSLSFVNTDLTEDNWSRIHFATTLSDESEQALVSIATQFRNKNEGEETADFVIATTGEGSYEERFRIAGNGNVGIGTSTLTDDFKLSVGGKLRAEEIEVSLSVGWADYVFADDYELKPLEEVEKYIQEHNHLPNIPSAKEVESEGLNLGEMQVKMMEKIEELTLYMIELKKENEALKELIK